MLIRPTVELPAVLRRAMDAYRANDPISIAEAFTTDARLTMRFEPKLAERLGLGSVDGPVHATSAVGIMKYYAFELSTYDVLDLEIVSALATGRDVAAVCQWSLKEHASGREMLGQCHNIWTLDRTGRKLVGAHTVCKIITPGFDHHMN